jgi:hypothetical protein
MSIPDQKQVNWLVPEEHFAWAMRNMPTFAGVGAVTHPGFLRVWSKHLWECGFAHRDYLVSLADENGMIHVDQLPAQSIKLQPAFRGPRNNFNNAAQWVPVDQPDITPMNLPDVNQLTPQENEAMLQQYRDAGLIPVPVQQPVLAEVFNDNT